VRECGDGRDSRETALKSVATKAPARQKRTQPILEQVDDTCAGNRGLDGKVGCGADAHDERPGRLELHHLPVAIETALGRVGMPDDIGSVVAFLCSKDSKWVSGQRLEVTGGYRL
jgi:NAD(P)-dependent dehydrogenase (short-subunit alcohol dehydrogenase family)